MIHGDNWIACGTPNDRDWVQVGTSYHSAGKSHVAKCGGYPSWGDNEEEEFEWRGFVMIYKDKQFISSMIQKWQDLAKMLERPENDGTFTIEDMKEMKTNLLQR